MSRKNIILYNTIILIILYLIVALFFSAIYVLLDLVGLGSIIDHYSSTSHQEQFIDLITRSLYFSSVTLFAVGYGDMSPLGLAKGVAIIQALIGYVLPYAIILNYLVFNPKFFRYHIKNRK